jgi:protein required for attachment to host cells
MARLQVKNGAWVMICDGKRALLLRNEGDAGLLNLRRVSVREQINPATRDQGSDAAGRAVSPTGCHSGCVEATDWHEIQETRFADLLADELNKAAHEHAFRELVVVAPPKTLAELRRELSKDAQGRIAAEIAKDLTHHTIPEIEKALAMHGA